MRLVAMKLVLSLLFELVPRVNQDENRIDSGFLLPGEFASIVRRTSLGTPRRKRYPVPERVLNMN